MRGYLKLFMIRVKALFQYRAAAFAGLMTQLFWGAIKIMILQAFIANGPALTPMTLEQSIAFIWIGQALIQMLPWNIDKELERQIRSGQIAYELLRPINLYGMIFCRSFALRMIPTFLRAIPLFIVAVLFLNFPAAVSTSAMISFLISLLPALLLASTMTACVHISLFWTLSSEGIQRIVPAATILLSGLVIPLPFFPNWMQPILLMQPFRGIIDIPARLYTGLLTPAELPIALTFQLFWVFVFVWLGKKMLDRAMRALVIQGG